ncbi:DUF502 domain-containing protein [Variovorax sp. J31P179]|uniref:DUF502 domain-containing protein n=1 Tax=Variovorax sp. J31P179 TaxID=3053508 RepID=UPI0025764A8F|nr:DUF502 domain-containing protein [Variovorax sp. J31P179]MDM0085439.1 DUF502 domain-containing protein [Variovorax sp. J31P179]
MKHFGNYLLKVLTAGAIVVVPLYLSVLLLLKVGQSLVTIVHPIAAMLPSWLPAGNLMSLLLVLVVCLGVGILISTPVGRAERGRLERSLFQRVPGYALFRTLTQRMAEQSEEDAWKPALVEFDEALVPAFVVEELDDGRCTVFVPSVPTPLAGAVHILDRKRVHPLDVPFAQAIRTISRWGAGSKDLVAAMKVQDKRI